MGVSANLLIGIMDMLNAEHPGRRVPDGLFRQLLGRVADLEQLYKALPVDPDRAADEPIALELVGGGP